MAAEQINEQKYHEVWTTPVIRLGISTMLLACVLSFIPLIYLYMVHGILPPFSASLTALGDSWRRSSAPSTSWSPSPTTPSSAWRNLISFLSGNISNLRLPCSAMAQEVVAWRKWAPKQVGKS